MFGKVFDTLRSNMIKTQPQWPEFWPWSLDKKFDGLITQIIMSCLMIEIYWGKES